MLWTTEALLGINCRCGERNSEFEDVKVNFDLKHDLRQLFPVKILLVLRAIFEEIVSIIVCFIFFNSKIWNSALT